MTGMDPEFAIRLIQSWNTDPLWADILRGRILVPQRAEGSIVVSWRDGDSLRMFVISEKEIMHSGWTDPLTDLIETLDRKTN